MTLKFSEPKINLLDKNEKIEVVSDDTTDYRWGVNPINRSIDKLLQYGVINLDKPPRPTSHEVVSYVKRILNIPKAGHSGTLDPLVTGVLPIALNKATRVLDALLLAGKEYMTVMQLHADVDEDTLKRVIKEFEGEIYQRPPLRASVRRVLRKRTIYDIDILEIKEHDVLFRVKCQAGTYIRKLCLHPSTQILTKNGLITIAQFYNNPCPIFTFNDGKLKETAPSAVQKVTSPPQLIRIIMETGVSFIATPDHEMLKSTSDGYTMTEVKDLKGGDYLVKSLRFHLPKTKLTLPDLLSDKVQIEQPEIKEKCVEAFIQQYRSLENARKTLNINIKTFDSNDSGIEIQYLKLAKIYDIVKEDIYRFRFANQSVEVKDISNLFYLVGLIASTSSYKKIRNRNATDSMLIFQHKERLLAEKFIEAHSKVFPNIKCYISEEHNLWRVSTSNALLKVIINSLGINNPSKRDSTPLLAFGKEAIRAYIKGFFDANGAVYYKEEQDTIQAKITIFVYNYYDALNLHKMLLSLEVENKICSTIVKDNSNVKKYTISIDGIGAQQRFIEEIGKDHPNANMETILRKITKIEYEHEYGDNFNIGLHYSEKVLKKREELKKVLGETITNESLPLTRKIYKRLLAFSDLNFPPLDDFIVEKIERIEKVSKINNCRYVYDMTIPTTHNFLIETGYVSSNCHDIGQALGCGAHMKELRRTQSGPFTEDTFLSTLQELYDAYAWYREENDDLPLRNIILPMEYAIKHLPKIFVKDSAVDALCHGAPLARPGITKYSTKFKAGDTIAILTLKHELIGLAEAQVNAMDIKDMEKGIIAKLKRVIMSPGTYPSIKTRD